MILIYMCVVSNATLMLQVVHMSHSSLQMYTDRHWYKVSVAAALKVQKLVRLWWNIMGDADF